MSKSGKPKAVDYFHLHRPLWRQLKKCLPKRQHDRRGGRPAPVPTESCSAAFKALAGRDLRADLAARGITLVGGALGEAPDAYKPVTDVIRYQQDLVEIVAEFNPRVVWMAD